MKPEIVLVAVIICLAMMSVTPALTAPRQIQDLCSEQARHVTFSYRGDYEGLKSRLVPWATRMAGSPSGP